MTLWQLAERRTPFDGLFDSPLAVAYNVVKYRARPDGTSSSPYRQVPDVVPAVRVNPGEHEAAYERLYIRCWDADVDRRPTADELVASFDRLRNGDAEAAARIYRRHEDDDSSTPVVINEQ